jgi:hypothetical protein
MSHKLFQLWIFMLPLLVLIACGCKPVRVSPIGGQTMDSPDGNYTVSVSSSIGNSDVAALDVKLESTVNGGPTLLNTRVEIPGRDSYVPLRESASVISWAADSETFSINIDGAKLMTIEVGALK